MERSILLTSLLLFAASTAHAQKLQPVKRLVVVDANNEKAGDVLTLFPGLGNGAYCALRINGHLAPLFVAEFRVPGTPIWACRVLFVRRLLWDALRGGRRAFRSACHCVWFWPDCVCRATRGRLATCPRSVETRADGFFSFTLGLLLV